MQNIYFIVRFYGPMWKKVEKVLYVFYKVKQTNLRKSKIYLPFILIGS